MSFTSEVKEELSHHMSTARHCRIAELTAIITMCGSVSVSAWEHIRLRIQTENINVAIKGEELIKKVFGIQPEIMVRIHGSRGQLSTYIAEIADDEAARRVLSACHLLTNDLDITEVMPYSRNLVLQRSCCRRSYLRGAFLVGGSISDPTKFYHFEISVPTLKKAQLLRDLICLFGPEAKIVKRKSRYAVYLKEGEQIVEMLGIMEANRSLMALENIRIIREVNNSVNRQVNCDTSNIKKTVNAATRQIQDIEYLERTVGIERLPENLQEAARVRLENRELPLQELGALLNPPLGKSGINHRLKKLSELAEKIREGRPE